MKTLMLISLFLGFSQSYASDDTVVTCYMSWTEQDGSQHSELSYDYDNGLTVKKCIDSAKRRKNTASSDVPFTFTHYTKINIVNGVPDTDGPREGWSVSSDVTDPTYPPADLIYHEFSHH